MEKTTLNTLSSLNSATSSIKKSFERVSTGLRINKASDDPAGLAVSEQLAVLTTLSKGASRNIDYGSSALAIADSALGQIGDITTRLSELATQSANGTLSDEQRGALQAEYSQLTQEIQRIGATAEFNGRPLLNGSTISIQAGEDGTSNSQISLTLTDISSTLASVGTDISTQGAALTSLDSLSSFSEAISSSRGQIGSVSSRLDSAKSGAESRSVAYAEAGSRIRDADMADEVGQLTAAKIKQQAATAVLAQGNLSRENVLRLLS